MKAVAVRERDAIHLASVPVLRGPLPAPAGPGTAARGRESSAQLGFRVRPARLGG